MRFAHPLAAGVVLATLSWMAAPAMAQDGGEEPAAETADPATTDPAADPTAEPGEQPEEQKPQTWAERRNITVYEPRSFRKNTRHEFTLFLGLVPNDDFFTYLPLGGRYNYFFREDFSFEIWGNYLATFESELKEYIQDNSQGDLLVEIPQTLQWMAGVDVTWSPFHGKLALFGDAMSTFDFHVAFGAGVIGTTVVNNETKVEESKFDVSGNLGLGFRMYLTDMVALRMDYRQYFYPAETGGLAYPMEITIGVSLWTAAPQ